MDETERSGADYLYDEKFKTVSPAQSAIDKVERALGIEQPLRPPQRAARQPPEPGAEGAVALPARRRLRRPGRRGRRSSTSSPAGSWKAAAGRRASTRRSRPKEGVAIQEENVTLATITLQNYFRLYEKLAGMTGTAKTEEKEFVEIYNLNVVEIPTNVAVARDDKNDYIFKTEGSEVRRGARGHQVERHEIGQPVLVGTIAVETSRSTSRELLTRRGHPAQRPEREGARARGRDHQGRRRSPARSRSRRTWPAAASTSSSPRASTELGGLYVLGTERHEARRIDNQLRGRSGRQGDPGESRFYLSGQDDLVRLFAGDRIHGIMERFKMPDDQPMEAEPLSKQIENAQKKVEEQNFVARKNVLKYDDVMNTQREVIYAQRRQVLDGADLSDEITSWIDDWSSRLRRRCTPRASTSDDWDLDGLVQAVQRAVRTRTSPLPSSEEDLSDDEPRGARRGLRRRGARALRGEGGELGAARSRGRSSGTSCSRSSTPAGVSTSRTMDYLREGVHLRAFAQKDPLVEYRSEGHGDVRGAWAADPRGGADAPLPRADRAA